MINDIATGSDISSPFCDEQNDVKGESLTQEFTLIFNVPLKYKLNFVTFYKTPRGSRDIARHFL